MLRLKRLSLQSIKNLYSPELHGVSCPPWPCTLVKTKVFQIASKGRRGLPCNYISDRIDFYFPTVHWAPACTISITSLCSPDHSTREHSCHVCLRCSSYSWWHMVHTSLLPGHSNESLPSLSCFNHAILNSKLPSFHLSPMGLLPRCYHDLLFYRCVVHWWTEYKILGTNRFLLPLWYCLCSWRWLLHYREQMNTKTIDDLLSWAIIYSVFSLPQAHKTQTLLS